MSKVSNRAWYALAAVLAAPIIGWVVLLAFGVQLAFNLTQSLPGHVYLIQPGVMPEKGEVVSFQAPDTARFFVDFNFLKEVRGIEGDLIEHQDGYVFINGTLQGEILSSTVTGEALAPGPAGVVPANTFFVLGKHGRSYDSRYKSIGFISKNNVIGRAVALF